MTLKALGLLAALILLAIVGLSIWMVADAAGQTPVPTLPTTMASLPVPQAGSLPSPGPPPTASEREETLKIRLDYAEKQADRLQKTIQWLVTISGLYAVILGLYAYFGLNRLVDGAQKDIDKTAKTLEDERKRLQDERDRSYPILTRIERNLASIVEQIERILPGYEERDWVRGLYRDLDDVKREQVLMSEASVASFEVLGLGNISLYAPRVALIYGRLGRFYGSRFADSRKTGQSYRGDRMRAIEYLEKAIGADPAKAVLHRDLGVMWDYGDTPDSSIRAERAYQKALSCDPQDPGARYNLATRWMDDRLAEAAVGFQALARDLETRPEGDASKAKYLWGCYFQLACIEQRLPGGGQSAGALGHLQTARKKAESANDLRCFLEDLENDLKLPGGGQSAGDLYQLREKFPEEVEALLRTT